MYLHFKWWQILLFLLAIVPLLPIYLYDYIKERRGRNMD